MALSNAERQRRYREKRRVQVDDPGLVLDLHDFDMIRAAAADSLVSSYAAKGCTLIDEERKVVEHYGKEPCRLDEAHRFITCAILGDIIWSIEEGIERLTEAEKQKSV